MVRTKKVCNFEVVKPKLKITKKPPFLNGFITAPTPAIGILGPRGHGKSTIIYNIVIRWLKERVKKKKPCKVFLFSAVVKVDPLYQDLTKPKKIKQTIVKNYLSISTETEIYTEIREVPNEFVKGFDSFDYMSGVLEYIKQKYVEEDILLVVDDFSESMRYEHELEQMVKILRHYASFIGSSQYYNDFAKGIRGNIDAWVVLKGVEDSKIIDLHHQVGSAINPNLFLQLYKEATPGKHDFFFNMPALNSYRKSFNDEFEID